MDILQEQWWEGVQKDENAVILDVRTEGEWNEGIIPGAMHIDIYKGQGFIYQVDELDKTKNYYIYCRSGGRSGQACNIMQQMGFGNTYNLVGGIMEWDGPIVTPE